MKRKKTCGLCILVCFFAYCTAIAQSKGIKFSSDSLDQVLRSAKDQNKMVFIDVYTTWCAPCKKMDQEVYTDKLVGDFANSNFISVRIQIDSDLGHDQKTKLGYQNSNLIKEKYNVVAYPTYLFLSSSGELLDRGVGFLAAADFLSLMKRSLNVESNLSNRMLRFQQNKLSANDLLQFALETKKVFQNDSLSRTIALAYKKQFVDQGYDLKLKGYKLDSSLIALLYTFPELFSFKDSLIKDLYLYPSKIDSANQTVRAISYTDYIITRDIINPYLYNNGKPIDMEPNWKHLTETISLRLDSITAKRNVVNTKTNFYPTTKQWRKAALSEIERINWSGIKYEDLMERKRVNNMIWDVFFEHNSDRSLLKQAIIYMKKVIDSDLDDPGFRDTYANLLYKNKQIKKAIKEEEKALQAAIAKGESERITNFKMTLIKMRNGEDTWSYK